VSPPSSKWIATPSTKPTSGYKFDLEEHDRDDMNASYLLTEVRHDASVDDSYGQGESESRYSNQFTCILASVPRPAPRAGILKASIGRPGYP
jgi:uncharacterized protein involved in type VI secretion and phage assembly